MHRDEEGYRLLLEEQVLLYNRPEFIPNDPICIPHLFTKKQDVEIAGFFASILAWGQRKTIIRKCQELMERMDGQPHEFVTSHSSSDLKQLIGFKHRTFNDTDLLYFVSFLRHHYQQFSSLEDAFLIGWRDQPFRAEYLDDGLAATMNSDSYSSPCSLSELATSSEQTHAPFDIRLSLTNFRNYFFSLPDFPLRTRKHISTPANRSTCKRLNMFLRWMVRKDEAGVDFGLWSRLKPSQLMCPYDVHVDRVARGLGLVDRKQRDWQTVEEVTARLRRFDPVDPVKYDFALFGMGVSGIL